MDLNLLLWIPLLTGVIILLCKELKQVRIVSFVGASFELVLSFVLLYQYWQERSAGNNAAFLFEKNFAWYAPLHINYQIGVDGISVAMILLTSFVVLAGVLVSWKMPSSASGGEKLSKEFFFLLFLLSIGAYGFFISLDLFTMFFFLELAVIPKFLLIGIWGSGKKEYSAMKLALMLMGGSALVFVGLAGLFFNTNTGDGSHTFDIVQIAQMHIPVPCKNYFSHLPLLGLEFSALCSHFIHGYPTDTPLLQLPLQCFLRVFQ